MNKLLLLLLVGIVVYLLLRQRRRVGGNRKSSPPPPSPEVMVSCAHCGLHIPASESMQAGGRYYCSDEHRRLDVDQHRK
jgi:uncharacterized protein